jgi:hypothetical protein
MSLNPHCTIAVDHSQAVCPSQDGIVSPTFPPVSNHATLIEVPFVVSWHTASPSIRLPSLGSRRNVTDALPHWYVQGFDRLTSDSDNEVCHESRAIVDADFWTCRAPTVEFRDFLHDISYQTKAISLQKSYLRGRTNRPNPQIAPVLSR